MIEGTGVKRVFKINASHVSDITQPHAVAQADLSRGGLTKRAIYWQLFERYLAIWRMRQIPAVPRMPEKIFSSRIGASGWKNRR